MWTRISGSTAAAVMVLLSVGCSQKSATQSAAPTVEDKVFTVTPASVNVNAGNVTGEVTDMKVTEEVEHGSGKVVTPAKLTGNLKLKNGSTDQSVRLIGGKILYIDSQGQPIKFKTERTEPTIKFGGSYNSSDRLNPGEEATQSLDVDFPSDALKGNKLKEIQVELSYIPSPLKEEKLDLNVAIAGQ